MIKKVLVAEDDVHFRKSLEEHIKSWGYEVVCANNGWEAYEMLSDQPSATFFAVVSDMRMPGGSGLVFCQAANRHGDCPPTLIHSSEVSYKGDGVEYKNISKLKEYFDFVKVTHVKPKHNNNFRYVKEFLESISVN